MTGSCCVPLRLVLLLTLALSASPLAAQDMPSPVLELLFDEGFRNGGPTGAEAKLTIYAEKEGAYFVPGPWCDCLDMTAASRLGGTLEQKNPAGSAVLVADGVLDKLTSFTVAFWMHVENPERDVAARIMTKLGSWEIVYGRGRPLFTAAAGREKHTYRPVLPHAIRSGDWTFFAMTVDVMLKRVRSFMGDGTGAFVASQPAEMTLLPARGDTPLQIGNFQGIRPFQGLLDNVRIYGVALPKEQVRRVFERDLAARSKGRSIYDAGHAYVRDRRFHPKASDIMFSTRWQKKNRGEFEALRDFHATYCLWVYGTKADYIRQVKQYVRFYEGTLNGMIGYEMSGPEPSAEGDTSGRQQDLDGNKTRMPHMVHWKGPPHWEGCHNNPGFRKIFWDEAAKLVAIGVDGIHVDDWAMSVHGANGRRGCFCPACMAGFRAYLKRMLSAEKLRELGIENIDTFDYRQFLKTKLGITNAELYKRVFPEIPLTPFFLDFQHASLCEFYAAFRKHLDTISPDKYIAVSVNNQFHRHTRDGGFGAGGYGTGVIDFYVGEPSQSMQGPLDFVHPCKISEAFGIPQVTWCKPRDLGTALAAHATIQALGQWSRVPWDLYMDNDPVTKQPAPRYFGTQQDWGAFYDFIHDHPHLLDGHESAATVGVLFSVDGAPYKPTREICRRLMELQAPFRVIATSSKIHRIPLDDERLGAFHVVINASPDEAYCEEDRQTIAAVRDARRTRFLTPDDDIEGVLRDYGLLPLRVEGPKSIYAFPRVKADAAVVHMVNWNVTPKGSADEFRNVTLTLMNPPQWGERLEIEYYRPGQEGGVALEPEVHHDCIRITLPRLSTWGVVEIEPGK